MSFYLRKFDRWAYEDMAVPEGCIGVNIARRMPDGQKYVGIFVLNAESRQSLASGLRMAKSKIREESDATWKPYRL